MSEEKQIAVTDVTRYVVVPDSMKTAAAAIEDKDLRQNALDLIEQMEDVVEGIGDVPQSWHPEFLRLVQATTDLDTCPEGAKPGKFIVAEEAVDSVDAIPLRLWKSRKMWSEDQNDTRAICESPDGKVGWRYGDCQTCPHSQWNEEENKAGCTKQIQVLCITRDLRTVFLATLAKTSYRAGMDWEKAMRSAKVGTYKRMYRIGSTKHKDKKQINLYEVTSVPRGEYDMAPIEGFLVELFNFISEMRRNQIEAFYANLELRRQNMALASPEPPSALLSSGETEHIEIVGGDDDDSQPNYDL